MATTATPWLAGMKTTAQRLNWITGPHCRARRTTDQSIGTGAGLVKVTWTDDQFNVLAMHSTSVNPTRLTVPSGGAGLYLVGTFIQWSSNNTGVRYASIKVNNSTAICSDRRSPASDGACEQTVSTIWYLNDADYIEAEVFHTATSAISVLGVNAAVAANPAIWAVRLLPNA